MKPLTKAENNVFNLLKQGFSSVEIAEKLNVAVLTVKSLEIRVYKKTGLKGRMELLANVVRQMNEKKNKSKKTVDN